MKQVKASDFPELRKVFTAYLHEDFLEEHATAAAALKTFIEDANDKERKRFREEAKRFLDATAAMELADVRALLSKLGSRWTPASRTALSAALKASSWKPEAGSR